jgi:glycosyltransferase involved in cell wall biosynthesis
VDAHQPRRVTLVANELRGLYPAGGMGTATTFLALALARMGHSVEILVSWQPERSLDPYWSSMYAQAGVRIQRVPDSGERVEPQRFGVMRTVELALRADPPDVVVVHDLGAPAYSALRLRHLGLAFEDVLFVVFCHGTRRWITEMSGRIAVPDMDSVLADSVLEQASLELADVVVSPSAYLIAWMRAQGWQLPERTHVIPYFTRSGATGEATDRQPEATGDDRVRRIAFFGRFEDKKGIRPFAAGVNRLDAELLRGVELEFVGKTTTTWTTNGIAALLSGEARRALRRVSFHTELDQHDALVRLGRPGTLAVMPSLGDNSPNTVYECLELGIPFVASTVGGIPELVAAEDRERVLFPPTAEGVENALRRALTEPGAALQPARPTFDADASSGAWAEVIAAEVPRPSPEPVAEEGVDVIVMRRMGEAPTSRTSAPHGASSFIERDGSSVEEARSAGLAEAKAPYVLFLAADDVPDENLLRTLVRAQRASGADVVTCAVRCEEEDGNGTVYFFSGDPGGLGALANDYGNVALFRRALLDDVTNAWPAERDPDWPLLAGLAASGARIVSVPLPLVTRTSRPGRSDDSAADALLVIERLERQAPDQLRLVARLAAGLAAVTRQ